MTIIAILGSLLTVYWLAVRLFGRSTVPPRVRCSWCGDKGYVPGWPHPRRCTCQAFRDSSKGLPDQGSSAPIYSYGVYRGGRRASRKRLAGGWRRDGQENPNRGFLGRLR